MRGSSKLAVSGLLVGTLLFSAAACGVSAKKTGVTTSPSSEVTTPPTSANSPTSGSESTSTGPTTTTTTPGDSTGLKTGAIGFYGDFKYTLTHAEVAPDPNNTANKVLRVTLDWQNLSAYTRPQPFSNQLYVSLRTDQLTNPSTLTSDPSAPVAPQGTGTAEMVIPLTGDPDLTKATIVLGDPNRFENPELPLGTAKPIPLAPKHVAISATLHGKTGSSLVVSGGELVYGDPTTGNQVEKGGVLLMLDVAENGGPQGVSLSTLYKDVQLKEPDGSLVPATTVIDAKGKGDYTLKLSPGQTKKGQFLVEITDNTQISGTYTLQIPADTGQSTATFSLP